MSSPWCMGRGQILLPVPSRVRHPAVTISSAWGSALCAGWKRGSRTRIQPYCARLICFLPGLQCSVPIILNSLFLPFFSLWKCLCVWKRLCGAFPAKQEPAEAVPPVLPPCLQEEMRACGHLLREGGFPQEGRE